jgi:hypothetical protein
MSYAANQLKSAQRKLAKLDKAIALAAAAAKFDATEQEKVHFIEFEAEVQLWEQQRELWSYIEHMTPFVAKLNRAAILNGKAV